MISVSITQPAAVRADGDSRRADFAAAPRSPAARSEGPGEGALSPSLCSGPRSHPTPLRGYERKRMPRGIWPRNQRLALCSGCVTDRVQVVPQPTRQVAVTA